MVRRLFVQLAVSFSLGIAGGIVVAHYWAALGIS